VSPLLKVQKGSRKNKTSKARGVFSNPGSLPLLKISPPLAINISDTPAKVFLADKTLGVIYRIDYKVGYLTKVLAWKIIPSFQPQGP